MWCLCITCSGRGYQLQAAKQASGVNDGTYIRSSVSLTSVPTAHHSLLGAFSTFYISPSQTRSTVLPSFRHLSAPAQFTSRLYRSQNLNNLLPTTLHQLYVSNSHDEWREAGKWIRPSMRLWFVWPASNPINSPHAFSMTAWTRCNESIISPSA